MVRVCVSVCRRDVDANLLKKRLGADVWHSGARRCLWDAAEAWRGPPGGDAAIPRNGSFMGSVPPCLSTLATFSPIFPSCCPTVKVLFWWRQHGRYTFDLLLVPPQSISSLVFLFSAKAILTAGVLEAQHGCIKHSETPDYITGNINDERSSSL